MQNVALSWLIWRTTGSGEWLGLLGFASSITTAMFGLVGGVFVDRIRRRKLILITQLLSLVQAAILLIFNETGLLTPTIIIVLALFLGAVYAFDFPARQSFISDMVGKDNADNAVALGSSTVHAARVIGPAIAGAIIAYRGESLCFFINAVTFLALIAAIALMDGSKLAKQVISAAPLHKSVCEGLYIAWKDTDLRYPLFLLAFMSVFGSSYYTVIPMIIGNIYGMAAEGYGFLMSVSACGALLGALIMAKMAGRWCLEFNIKASSLGYSISLIIFSRMGTFTAGAIAVFSIGLFSLVFIASINSWLQKISPDHARGRIMSLFTMMFFGVVPFGSLLIGCAAERIGPENTLAIGGAICLAASAWFSAIRSHTK